MCLKYIAEWRGILEKEGLLLSEQNVLADVYWQAHCDDLRSFMRHHCASVSEPDNGEIRENLGNYVPKGLNPTSTSS